jgi:hypothetical protein
MLTSADNGHWTGSFEVMFIQLDEKNNLLDATQKISKPTWRPTNTQGQSKRESAFRRNWNGNPARTCSA